MLCADLKNIMTAGGSLQMHRDTKALCDFIGSDGHNFIGKNLAKLVKSYPIQWSDEDKSKYLIGIMSSTRILKDLINRCGISWPKNKFGDGMCEELQILKDTMEAKNKEKERTRCQLRELGRYAEANKIKDYRWNYDINYPNDLVRLVRNLWKQYDSYSLDIKVLKFLSSMHAKQGATID